MLALALMQGLFLEHYSQLKNKKLCEGIKLYEEFCVNNSFLLTVAHKDS